MKSRAFTMAEVLITIGIIGIVAAMTLPTVVKDKRNKELETAFKKQYNVISSVLDYMYAQDMQTTPDVLSSGDLYKTFNKISKVIKTCTPNDNDPDLCFTKSSDSSYKDLQRKVSTIKSDEMDDYQIILIDGALITFNSYKGTVTIGMDVNGKTKQPNTLGYDVFLFDIGNKGGRGVLVPRDGEDKINCTLTGRTSAYNGKHCAYWALKDPNWFRNLP